MSDSPSYLQYDADQLVRETEVVHYFTPNDQALFIVQEVYCLGYRWEEIYSYVNDTDEVYQKDIEYTIETKVTTSNTDEISASIGLQLKGLIINIGGSQKTITEKDITNTYKEAESIKVGPKSKIYFYRKVFSFRIRTWFINDAWGNRWRVGGYGNYTPCSIENIVDHETKTHYRSPSELKGTTSVSVEGIYPKVTFYGTRKFENCTQRCKDCIHQMGVVPPHVIRMAIRSLDERAEITAVGNIHPCDHVSENQTGPIEAFGKGPCQFIWGDGKRCRCTRWVYDPHHSGICGECGHSPSYHR